MKRAVLLALAGMGMLGAAAHAQQPSLDTFQVNNFTASGGDPTYPVVSDVTFTNLSLLEYFNNAPQTSVPVALFDLDGNPQTSLDTGLISLQSAPFDPTANGGLANAVLTGSFNTGDLPDGSGYLNYDISQNFNGPVTTLPGYTTFSSQLGAISTSDMTGSNVTNFAAGTFDLVDANGNVVKSAPINVAAVPETNTLALFLIGLGAVLTATLRRRTKTS